MYSYEHTGNTYTIDISHTDQKNLLSDNFLGKFGSASSVPCKKQTETKSRHSPIGNTKVAPTRPHDLRILSAVVVPKK